MSHEHSVTALIEKLQDGDSLAAQDLWSRFIDKMIRSANRRLKNLPRRMVDEEDVAVAAFEAFLRGQKEGRFERLSSREDLWQILAMLIERKAIREMRFQLAKQRDVRVARGESVFARDLGNSVQAGLDNFAEPDGKAVEVFTENVREILEQIKDPVQREIAIQRLSGYSNAEIAEQIGKSVATVERKFRLLRDSLNEIFSLES